MKGVGNATGKKRKNTFSFSRRVNKKEIFLRGSYPKRNIPLKSYEESPDLQLDEFIYCDLCMREYQNECPQHKLIVVRDTHVAVNESRKDRAKLTLPKDILEILPSSIENAGDGVWAARFIPAGVRFGPYEGTIIKNARDKRYCWQLNCNGKIQFVDGKDTSKSNWMRYVNCSRNVTEQNLIAFQYCGSIYYRTIKNISPKTELLVFYGREYAEMLGINVKNYNLTQRMRAEYFKCWSCYLVFRTRRNFIEHLPRCSYQSDLRLVYHGLDEESGAIYKCNLCVLSFANVSGFETHVKEVHELSTTTHVKKSQTEPRAFKKKKKNQCIHCRKYFAAPYCLKRHLSVHTGSMEYKCDICNSELSKLYEFNRHKLTHGGNNLYNCKFCGDGFINY